MVDCRFLSGFPEWISCKERPVIVSAVWLGVRNFIVGARVPVELAEIGLGITKDLVLKKHLLDNSGPITES